MIEYGSDFHYIIPKGKTGHSIMDVYPNANYYADGRQALIHLYRSQGWKRLWVPQYYCYDVVESLKQAGLDLMFYTDYPDNQDCITLNNISGKDCFKPGDALLRINYFGMRTYRCSDDYHIAAIVEDHTHDLIGDWARRSTADWCIASLRKTLPIPEGGILWSPLGHSLPIAPSSAAQNEELASIRWNAMKQKKLYLSGDIVDKSTYRKGFIDTESLLEKMPICSLDYNSHDYLKGFDIYEWYQRKIENWKILRTMKMDNAYLLNPEENCCNPFSYVFVFESTNKRDEVKGKLIESNVYPAILWNIPSSFDDDVLRISQGILSIHCDGRYSTSDILHLKEIIELSIQ